MSTFLYIIIASILESLVALIGILFLLFGYNRFKKYLHYLISFSVGTFLAVVFFELLPEAMEKTNIESASFYTLGGFLFFFLLSHFLRWYHHHEGDCCEHENIKVGGHLVLVGDLIHNFIDGIIIALAFLVSIPIGIATTIAVLSHEFPQEASDFFILINSGFSKGKALLLNFLVSLSTVFGAVLTYFTASEIDKIIGPALGIVAGNFLYIAMSDLIPELNNKHPKIKDVFFQFLFILFGILLIYLIMETIHHH